MAISGEDSNQYSNDIPNNNVEEIENKINLMLTMHSKKRDELRFRSWLLEVITVVSSIIICSMTFYDYSDSEYDWVLKFIITGFSIVMVICSLVWLHSTSKSDAQKHSDVTRGYSKLKKELEGFKIENQCTKENLDTINKQIAEISDKIQISERDFIRLKQYHKRKEYYRANIKNHLSEPYCIAKFHMWRQLRIDEKRRQK